jgi:hypothetical protein
VFVPVYSPVKTVPVAALSTPKPVLIFIRSVVIFLPVTFAVYGIGAGISHVLA